MHIDLTYLDTVSGGDKQFIRDILELFLTSTMADTTLLKEAIHRNDWAATASAAHKIKSSVNMLGNPEASALVASIEGNARNQEGVDNIASDYSALENKLFEMAEAIRQYLATN